MLHELYGAMIILWQQDKH